MNTQSKVLKWSLIIGIVIVLNLFFNYALSLVYKQPDFALFCPSLQVITQPETQDQCVSKGGQWTYDAYYGKPLPLQVGEVRPAGYCDPQYTCRQAYDSAQKTYDRNVFVTLVILGALMVFVGNFFKGNEVVSNSFALGGVLSFIIASMRYWSSADDLIKVVILAIALALLFWVAIKKFRS